MNVKKVLKTLYLNTYKTGVYNFIPDLQFVELQYRAATGKKLNIYDPQTFNEKIQWIKLYDHNPLYTVFADKLSVRDYVADKIGSQYLIPLIGLWNCADDIFPDVLPNRFVIKNSHDSGGVFICRDKGKFDFESVKKQLKRRMQHNYYYVSREWGYKNVKPHIIAEELLEDKKNGDLRDYKIFCFAGKAMYIQVDFDRFTNHKRNLYDKDWNCLDLRIKCANDKSVNIEKPAKLSEMLMLAEKLSYGIPQLRVDLYLVDDKIFFGELTVYHGGGIEPFYPDSYELEWGKKIDLDLAYKG